MAQAKRNTEKIAWWNRPMTWAIGLMLVVALMSGFVGSLFGPPPTMASPSPADDFIAPVSAASVDSVAPVVSEPLPPPAATDAKSGDAGISINGDNNTINYNATPPAEPLAVSYRPRVERVTVIEEQPIIVERTIRRQLPPRRVEVAPRDPYCEEQLAQHETRVASWSALFNK